MPSILEFPAKHPKPELALRNLLHKYNVTDFGNFGVWYAPVYLGVKSNWLPYNTQAKIDTGASISLFPKRLANDMSLGSGIPYEFYGVVRKKICVVDVELHKVKIKIVDINDNEIVLKDCWVAFTTLDRSPVLLGYKDVLERLTIGQKSHTDILTLEQ